MLILLKLQKNHFQIRKYQSALPLVMYGTEAKENAHRAEELFNVVINNLEQEVPDTIALPLTPSLENKMKELAPVDPVLRRNVIDVIAIN